MTRGNASHLEDRRERPLSVPSPALLGNSRVEGAYMALVGRIKGLSIVDLPRQSAAGGKSFSNVFLNVGEFWRKSKCMEVRRKWTFCTISYKYTDHFQNSGYTLSWKGPRR